MTMPSASLREVSFASGIIWIVLAILMFYLAYEHFERKKFPQNVIIFLLAVNMSIRCVWFFNYVQHGDLLIMLVANRAAILLQFTALSILILMWIRALQLTAMVDKIERLSLTTNPGVGDGRNDEQRSSSASTTSSSATTAKQVKLETERQQRRTVRSVIVVNLVVWIAILASLAVQDNNLWYDINIISISVLCLLLACFTLVIGLRTSIALNRELSPVMIANNNNLNKDSQGTATGLVGLLKKIDCCGCASFYSIYTLFFSKQGYKNGLQLQKQVLKTIISVSFIIFFFFLLRSLCFLNVPVLGDGLHDYKTAYEIGDVVYPFFYYQLPDFFPNFAIAYGISPPKSFIRRCVHLVTLRPDPDGNPNFLLQLVSCRLLKGDTSGRFAHRRASENPSFYTNDSIKSTLSDSNNSFVAAPHRPSRTVQGPIRTTVGAQTTSESAVPPRQGHRSSAETSVVQNPLVDVTAAYNGDIVSSSVENSVVEAKSNGQKEPQSMDDIFFDNPSLNSLRSSEVPSESGSSFSRSMTSFSISKPIPIQPEGKTSGSFLFGSKKSGRKSALEDEVDDVYDDADVERDTDSNVGTLNNSSLTGSSIFGNNSVGSFHPSSAGSGVAQTSRTRVASSISSNTRALRLTSAEEWERERKQSADYAEMIYRINSLASVHSVDSSNKLHLLLAADIEDEEARNTFLNGMVGSNKKVTEDQGEDVGPNSGTSLKAAWSWSKKLWER